MNPPDKLCTPPVAVLRDAASLILLKQSGNGLQILMGLRHAGHKFLPNKMVFPGGGVDAQDIAAPVALPLRPAVLRQLQNAASAEMAAALGIACGRELREETGLTLGEPPDLSGLHYLCRAETPPDRAIRFNARFFIADAGCATGDISGSGELEMIDWYDLDAVLKLDLAEATRAVLGQLQIWLTLDSFTRETRLVPALINRVWSVEG